MVDYSETIEIDEKEVGVFNFLNKYMDINMYQGSRSFFGLCPRSLKMKLDLR